MIKRLYYCFKYKQIGKRKEQTNKGQACRYMITYMCQCQDHRFSKWCLDNLFSMLKISDPSKLEPYIKLHTHAYTLTKSTPRRSKIYVQRTNFKRFRRKTMKEQAHILRLGIHLLKKNQKNTNHKRLINMTQEYNCYANTLSKNKKKTGRKHLQCNQAISDQYS